MWGIEHRVWHDRCHHNGGHNKSKTMTRTWPRHGVAAPPLAAAPAAHRSTRREHAVYGKHCARAVRARGPGRRRATAARRPPLPPNTHVGTAKNDDETVRSRPGQQPPSMGRAARQGGTPGMAGASSTLCGRAAVAAGAVHSPAAAAVVVLRVLTFFFLRCPPKGHEASMRKNGGEEAEKKKKKTEG